MFVLFDGLAFQTGSRDRGIGRYSANLLAALRAARPGWRIEVVEHVGLPLIADAVLAGGPARRFVPPVPLTPDTRPVVERYYADWLAAQAADWVVHASLYEFAGAVPRYPAAGPGRARHAAVLYDLIPLLYPDQYMAGGFPSAAYADRVRTWAGADLLLAISAATAADAARLFGPGVPEAANIRGACDPRFARLPAGEAAAAEAAVRAKFGLGNPFVLYVGGDDRRKNMDGAVAGFAAVPAPARRGVELVLCCHLGADARRHLEELATRLGVGGAVRVTGFVSDDDLAGLYHACRVFFFPSFYEGLGLPVLEAMRCGAPVVAAAGSSLPECAGPAAWYCDPADPASMAAALAAALAEPKDARLADRDAHLAGFTWPAAAERAAQALERADPRPAPRRRVAWVAAPPPAGDAAAAAALAGRFDLDWVHGPTPVPPEVARQFWLVPSADLPSAHAARPYDAFVYHPGDAPAAAHVAPLMARFPGVVVLPDEVAAQDAGWVAGAAVVAVRSAAAWRRVRQVTAAPVVVVPAPLPPPAGSRAAARRRAGVAADAVWISVAGPGGDAAAVVRLVGRLPADVRETITVAAEPCAPADRDGLLALASGLGVRVEFDDVAAPAADVWVALAGGGPARAALAAGVACVVGPDFDAPSAAVVRVRPAVAADLDAAVARLVADPAHRRRVGAAGRAFAAATHSPAAVIAGYAAVVAAAAARRRAGAGWVADTRDLLAGLPGGPPAWLAGRWARLRADATGEPGGQELTPTGGRLVG